MDVYGPPLPPGYVKPVDDVDEEEESKTNKVIGPLRPSFLSKRSDSENEESDSENEKSDSEIEKSDSENEKCDSENEKCNSSALEKDSTTAVSSIGPQLPPHLRNETSSDVTMENICGPALTEFSEVDSIVDRKAEIEKRAIKMRDKLNNKDIPVKVSEREEWMTVPDTSRRNQLGAISRCLAPSKSSSKKHRHSHHQSEKDEKTSEELKKYNKSRRSESLMDSHAKKLKKKEKEKKSKEKKERKAFDREEMGTRLFSKEQVNSVIDKAKYLNSRFAAGNSSKFL